MKKNETLYSVFFVSGLLAVLFTVALMATSSVAQEEECVPTGPLTEITEQVTGVPLCYTVVRPYRFVAGKIVSVEVKRVCEQVTVGDKLDSCGDIAEHRKSVSGYSVSFRALSPVSDLSQLEMDAIGVEVVSLKGLNTEAMARLSDKLPE